MNEFVDIVQAFAAVVTIAICMVAVVVGFLAFVSFGCVCWILTGFRVVMVLGL